MPKVKIVIATESSNDYDDYYSSHIIRQGITDWEEISDEDLNFLNTHKWHIVDRTKYGYGAHPIVLVQDDITVVERISSIKDFVRQEEEKRKAQEEAARKKREAAKLKKELAKKAKTEAEELALLNALKEKYENGETS